jgi:hypothetical protein
LGDFNARMGRMVGSSCNDDYIESVDSSSNYRGKILLKFVTKLGYTKVNGTYGPNDCTF